MKKKPTDEPCSDHWYFEAQCAGHGAIEHTAAAIALARQMNDMIQWDNCSAKSRCIKLSIEEYRKLIQEARDDLDAMIDNLQYMP